MQIQVQYILLTIVLLGLHKAQCGEHPDGVSEVSRAQDALGNYHFSYSVANSEGDQFRKEGTDSEGRVIGSYGLTHADGTKRVVDYVADQHGFRAEVRSNEPGVAPAADVHVDHQPPALAVAATSDNFGKRLLQSDVTYKEDTLDDTAREQRNFDDYRPLNPVAYYPDDARVAPGLPRTVQRPLDIPRSPRLLRPESNPNPPADVYYPPLDPHSAVRRPAEYVPRSVDSDRNYYQTTTSRKPYIPPYGGFDDDPVPEVKPPGVSMTTIHGGLGGSRRHIPSPGPTPSYRFPPPSDPDTRDFGFPRFPPPLSSRFPSSPPREADRVPQFVPGLPQTPLFSPPSYPTRGGGPTNFVLRAVPIQNGIQAVRVDPSTGRIYERLVYPLYLRHDGHPAYDRNILLHNDDVSDDDEARDSPPGYLDIPYQRYRGPRERPVFDDDEREDNRSFTDTGSLNRPTASDLDWVHRQLALVEGFDTDRLTNGLSSYQEGEPPSQFSSRLRMRHTPGLFDYGRGDQSFTRSPRYGDGNESRQRLLEESASDVKPVTESASQIEKEGN